MYVKHSWRTYKGKRYVQYHIAEAYRDPETKKPRSRMLLNITHLPEHVIEAIRVSLRTGRAPCSSPLSIEMGDALRGAGLMAVYRQWKQCNMAKVLAPLTEAEQTSMLLMVIQRILQPGSKLSLERTLEDTVLLQSVSKNRADVDELYRVMDRLEQHFYAVQENLLQQRKTKPRLCLYDITSTYFEGTQADEGAYGHSPPG